MEILQLLITATGGALVALVGSLILWRWNRKAQKEDKDDDIRAGLRILLYDRIKFLGKSYISRGWVTAEELEDLISMHKIYHDNLKGNGFLDSLMDQVKRLPIHK